MPGPMPLACNSPPEAAQGHTTVIAHFPHFAHFLIFLEVVRIRIVVRITH